MKINEVEALVGITRKNIRFYEQEGLLSPGRDHRNGYRDYGETEVDILRKIKLLRKLGLPLSEIRAVEQGGMTLNDALRRHLVTLEREIRSAQQSQAMCQELLSASESLETLDAQGYLEAMERQEQEGTTFMNKQNQDYKDRVKGPILSCVVMVLLMLAAIAVIIWAELYDPIPIGIIALILMIPAAVIVGTLLALYQRMQELKGGEEDAAGKY